MSVTTDIALDVEPAVATDRQPEHEGRVKWFNDAKGFGFLIDEDGHDVFVHYAVIEGEGFKTLEENEQVRFDREQGPKGRRATRVIRTA